VASATLQHATEELAGSAACAHVGAVGVMTEEVRDGGLNGSRMLIKIERRVDRPWA